MLFFVLFPLSFELVRLVGSLHRHFVAFPFVFRRILAVLTSAFQIACIHPLCILFLLVCVAQQPKPLDIEGLWILQTFFSDIILTLHCLLPH